MTEIVKFDQSQANIISYVNFGLLFVLIAAVATILVLVLEEGSSYNGSFTVVNSELGALKVGDWVGPVVSSSVKTNDEYSTVEVSTIVKYIGGEEISSQAFNIGDSMIGMYSAASDSITIVRYQLGGYGEKMVKKDQHTISRVNSSTVQAFETFAYQNSMDGHYFLFYDIDGSNVRSIRGFYLGGDTIQELNTAVFTSNYVGATTTFTPYIYFFGDSYNAVFLIYSTGSEGFHISISGTTITISASSFTPFRTYNAGNRFVSLSRDIMIGVPYDSGISSGVIYELKYDEQSKVLATTELYTVGSYGRVGLVTVNQDTGIIGIIIRPSFSVGSSFSKNMIHKIILVDPYTANVKIHDLDVDVLDLVPDTANVYIDKSSMTLNSHGLSIHKNVYFAKHTKLSILLQITDVETKPTIQFVRYCIPLRTSMTSDNHDFAVSTNRGMTRGFLDSKNHQLFTSEKESEYPIGIVKSISGNKAVVEYKTPLLKGYTGLKPGFAYYNDKTTNTHTTKPNRNGSEFIGIAVSTTELIYSKDLLTKYD